MKRFPSDAKRPEYRRRWRENHPEKERCSAQRWQNRIRDARRTFGLCPLCAREAEVDHKYCERCLEKNRERMTRRRAARKSRNTVREILKTPTIGEKRKI